MVFGAGFLFLTIYLVSQLFDQDTASAFGSIQVGIALALAAWFLGDTPYRVLTQVTWGYAAAFLVVLPAISWLMDRRRGSMDGRSFPDTSATTTAPARKPFTFSVLGDFILIGAAVVGFFMGLAFLTRVWGLLAAAAGFVLWPLTVLALPWYAGFAHQEWWPLAVVYGGGVVGWLLSRSGEKKTVTTDD